MNKLDSVLKAFLDTFRQLRARMISNSDWAADDEAVVEDDDDVQIGEELEDVLVPVEAGEPPGGCLVLCSVQDVVGEINETVSRDLFGSKMFTMVVSVRRCLRFH